MASITYDRLETAKRLRKRRQELGITAARVAKQIGKADHYYRDIERGVCGMSLETLIAISLCLGLSIDYIIYGSTDGKEAFLSEQQRAAHLLARCDDRTRGKAVMLLETFVELAGGDAVKRLK